VRTIGLRPRPRRNGGVEALLDVRHGRDRAPTSTVWQMGDALGGLRLTLIMLLGLTALVAWLIVAYDLWEKPDRKTSAELARLFNRGTTLTLATAVSYVALSAGTVLSRHC